MCEVYSGLRLVVSGLYLRFCWAGEASSLLGIAGYVVGAVVSPLVGLGNVLHSTAIAYVIVMLVVIVFYYISKSLPRNVADEQMD